MNDRAIQDAVIRALADAPYRAGAEWKARALADPERVERYARFLARHFYHERIVHFFKYSRALARATQRHPETVLASSGFTALLPSAVLGSRETARAVARLVVDYVMTSDARIPYLADLLEYERAMMVVESGPRVWREPRDSGLGTRDSNAPETVEGTVLLGLDYDLPVVLPELLKPWTEVPTAPDGHVKLLIARSKHGRVAVARTTEAVASIVELADGRKSLEDIARQAGLRPAELEATVQGLVELGAVRFSTGS